MSIGKNVLCLCNVMYGIRLEAIFIIKDSFKLYAYALKKYFRTKPEGH